MNDRHNSSAKEVMHNTVDEEIIAADNYIHESEEDDEENRGGDNVVKESEIPFSKPIQRESMEIEDISAIGQKLIEEEEDDDFASDSKQKEQIERARHFRDSHRSSNSGSKKIEIQILNKPYS